MRASLPILFLLAFAGPAQAALTERDLALVQLAARPDARAPLALAFRTFQNRTVTIAEALSGRPALLIPADYTCRSVCGPALAIAASALSETGLRPGADYRLIVVGIDAKDSLEQAAAMAEARIGDPAIFASTSILTGDAATVQALTDALGYGAVYDRENDQFAHPSVAVALTRDGRASRVLSSLALDPQDLRLALVEAGEGRIGGLKDRISLVCYGFDPVHGIYTLAIQRLLGTAGALTVCVLALALAAFHRRSRAKRLEEGAS